MNCILKKKNEWPMKNKNGILYWNVLNTKKKLNEAYNY